MDTVELKMHSVQGCEYREYRGAGHPSTMKLRPAPGDLYMDITGPYSVWVYKGRSKGWVEWHSMKDTQHVPHQEQDQILLPNTSRFAWVPAKGIVGYQRQAEFLLGDRDDTAHSYVYTILEKEGAIEPNVVAEKQSKPTSSNKVDSEGGSDEGESEKVDESEKESKKGDEPEGEESEEVSEYGESEKGDESGEEKSEGHSVQGNNAYSDSDELMVDDILSNTPLKGTVSPTGYDYDTQGEEDISMEIDFEVRCLDMRTANAEIRQATLNSSGMIYVHKI